MGFSCFACRGPFEQDTRGPGLEQGGGDGQAMVRSVSAVSKCGHLFHTDCLKKILQTQSSNAWVSKACPVCRQIITMQDIIRIHASTEDAPNNQRPRMEELMLAHRKLREEYEGLLKLYNHACAEFENSKSETKAIMRSKEEVILRLEHMVRLNSVAKSDIDRFKAEIEKLKNIIITLTGKLTGNESLVQEYYGGGAGSSMNMNGGPMSSNMNGGNTYRLEYSEDFQRAPICDQAQNLMNGSLPNGTPHHHPPGFARQLPSATENGSECQKIEQPCPVLPISPSVRREFEANGVEVKKTASGNYILAGNHQQGRVINAFTVQDIQVRDYDRNNNRCFGRIGEKVETTNLKNKNDNAPKENAPVPPLAESLSKAVADARKTESDKSRQENGGTLPFSNSEQNKVDNEGDSADIEDDEHFDVTYDKWQEKKSRRRASSKGSGNGVRSGSSKLESLTDKKLLYGSFSCDTCNAKWGSSQSVLNKPQTCRYCKTEVLPYNQGPILSRKQLEINKQGGNNAASDRKK